MIPSVIRSTAVRNVYDPTNLCSMTRKQELVGLTSVYKELKKKKIHHCNMLVPTVNYFPTQAPVIMCDQLSYVFITKSCC